VLPIDRAFVLQLADDADVGAGQVVGRAEHVVSGRTVHFATLDDLLAFVAGVIANEAGSGARDADPDGGADDTEGSR